MPVFSVVVLTAAPPGHGSEAGGAFVKIDGREALHTEMSAKLDGVSKRFTVFVFKKNGCVYDFMHIAPPTAPAEGRREFVSFVQGFSTITRAPSARW